ncbi:MAG: DUF1330 domain-containing protein [Pseudomonadota bacterium]
MSRFIDPERAQFEAFKALPRDEPIQMLNLVRFNAEAQYDDGTVMSGADAYRLYGEASAPVFARVGGTIVWRGKPQVVLIGPEDEQWDTAFIARYPNAGAFLAMVTDDEYRKAVVHRQAAVLTSRLIRMAELQVTPNFAD